ncbi:MAG: permease, partial [Candidatus Izemoplasmataceae bacterium]
RSFIQNSVFFITLLLVLIFWYIHWIPTLIVVGLLIIQMVLFFEKDELLNWGKETFLLAKKIIPLFIIGIFLAGVIGSLLNEDFVVSLVGNNTYQANLLAGTFGAFMYFATLTEVPIVNMFIHTLGMHKGPAVALLLAGPSLSLPNMIVISKVLGLKKASTFFILVITLSAVVGLIAGMIIGG